MVDTQQFLGGLTVIWAHRCTETMVVCTLFSSAFLCARCCLRSLRAKYQKSLAKWQSQHPKQPEMLSERGRRERQENLKRKTVRTTCALISRCVIHPFSLSLLMKRVTISNRDTLFSLNLRTKTLPNISLFAFETLIILLSLPFLIATVALFLLANKLL